MLSWGGDFDNNGAGVFASNTSVEPVSGIPFIEVAMSLINGLVSLHGDRITGVDPVVFLPTFQFAGVFLNSVVADSDRVVTVEGVAGPGNIGFATVRFEVLLGGDARFVHVLPAPINIDGTVPLNFSFPIPLGFDFDGLSGILVTESSIVGRHESDPVVMTGENFTNVPDPDPLFWSDPDPHIVSVDIDESTHQASLIAEAGPTDAPLVTVRWEAEIAPNIRVVLLERHDEVMDSRRTFNDSVTLPPLVNMQDAIMRFVVIPQGTAIVVS
jgi:hypothetical protein